MGDKRFLSGEDLRSPFGESLAAPARGTEFSSPVDEGDVWGRLGGAQPESAPARQCRPRGLAAAVPATGNRFPQVLDNEKDGAAEPPRPSAAPSVFRPVLALYGHEDWALVPPGTIPTYRRLNGN